MATLSRPAWKNLVEATEELLARSWSEMTTRPEPGYMAGLMEKYRGMLDRMQGPEQRAAADKLFRASP